MVRRLALVAFVTGLAGCGGGGHSFDSLLIRQDDASDEVLLSMMDKLDQGLVTIDDAQAPHLTSPAGGAQLPSSPPASFAWQLPASTRPAPRHGVGSGQFVWLRLEGPGMERAIDVLSIGTTTWTPDAEAWALLGSATGPVACTMITAYAMDGVIREGPFRASETPSFTIAP